MTRRNTPGDQGLVSLEINQLYIGSITDQDISITALQRGTGNDAMPTRTTYLINPGSDRAQPRATILVGQGNTFAHLVDIGCGMKPVGILKLPMQTLGKQCTHGRLAAPGNAHQDDNGRKGRRFLVRHHSSHPHCCTCRGLGGSIDSPMKSPDKVKPASSLRRAETWFSRGSTTLGERLPSRLCLTGMTRGCWRMIGDPSANRGTILDRTTNAGWRGLVAEKYLRQADADSKGGRP